jgi:hypothetical protein
MDPHGPTVTWPHVIKTAPDQGNFRLPRRSQGFVTEPRDRGTEG